MVTEETVNEPTAEGANAEAPAEKKTRKRGGNRKPRDPKLKDWIRVLKSQGTGLDNQVVNLIVNEANGIVRLVTQAPVKEGEAELEAPRTQIFRINGINVINDPTDDPLAKIEEEAAAEAATENTAEAAAPEA